MEIYNSRKQFTSSTRSNREHLTSSERPQDNVTQYTPLNMFSTLESIRGWLLHD